MVTPWLLKLPPHFTTSTLELGKAVHTLSLKMPP